ncbi:MAG: EAL domain-containing protein [Deltaproteobacteria bacterium]|nr:EAL domain-containing protein [Deltaproteobacteria bacterium]MBW2415582.1 EAL domain-containing protein [Deltaproteobacteria bacterium]
MALILFIDGDEVRLQALTDAIRGRNRRCRTAVPGPAAVEAVTRMHPDLVVLGLGGEADSEALTRSLREVHSSEELPILVCGDGSCQDDAVLCLEAGATDWVSLPLHDSLIRARVQSLLDAQRERMLAREQEHALAKRRDELDSTLTTLEASQLELDQTSRSRHFLATHDRVTGLPNRELFEEFAERAITFSLRHGQIAALLTIDLDRFSRINDSLNHSIGDQLLTSCAERTQGCLRRSEMVARLGGDELTVLLLNLSSPRDATVVAEKVLASISEPHQIAGHELRITSSIGVALFPEHGESLHELIRHSRIAMHSVKQQGRNACAFYDGDLLADIGDQAELERDLHSAIERGELITYYQPQVDARKGTLIGAEALLRWLHPDRGLVPPGLFIPIAEETGLIGEIGAWVLREACQQKRRWEQAGFAGFPIGVNVSFRQLKAGAFAELVVQVLDETGLDPTHLNIEVTENVIMDDLTAARDSLTVLSDAGVRVSIDDFGTGYSSLSVLGKFPAHILKIDRAFVRDITTDDVQAAVARTVIAVASELGLDTIAEGVETPEQMEFLAELGCEHIQGFLFSPPVDPEEFARQWGDGEPSEIRLTEK